MDALLLANTAFFFFFSIMWSNKNWSNIAIKVMMWVLCLGNAVYLLKKNGIIIAVGGE